MVMTFEQLLEIVTRASVTAAELTEGHKDTRALMAELTESHKELAEAQKKTELALQRTEFIVQQTTRNLGGINTRLGEIVEMIVLPSLMKKMNELGHNFTIASLEKTFSKNGEQFAEIDLMLENGGEVMAVEAKARFKLGEMNDLLNRVKLLRQNETITGVAGKTIYVAVAAVGFDKPARKLAEDKGMYIIEIDQDNDNIKINAPPQGKIGKW
jgi:predicted AAA+ superfamily ATPase